MLQGCTEKMIQIKILIILKEMNFVMVKVVYKFIYKTVLSTKEVLIKIELNVLNTTLTTFVIFEMFCNSLSSHCIHFQSSYYLLHCLENVLRNVLESELQGRQHYV